MSQIEPASSPKGGGANRRDRVLQMTIDQGYCTTAELSHALGVSEMTVRRDIAKLETSGMLRSVHGGVTSLTPAALMGSDFRERESAKMEIKRALALSAIDFIAPSGIIAIDAGTTTSEISLILPLDRRLSVVSNSLPVFNNLVGAPNVELLALGGTLHPDSLSFAGPLALQGIAELRIGTLFLGASGISERGVFCGNDFDAVTKRALIDVADKVVLVSDSSKLTETAMARVCPLSAIDHLIVDSNVSADQRRMLEHHEIRVTVVPIPETQ